MKRLRILYLLFALLTATVSSSFNVFDIAKQAEQSAWASENRFVPFVSDHIAPSTLSDKIKDGNKVLYHYQYFTGTTYYFASGGSTGNSGLTVGSPWPLSKFSTTGVAGDSLLFKKGDTFLPSAVTYTRSGSIGNPIVIDCYGTALANPVFDANNTSSAAIYLNGCSYININNIAVQHSSTGAEAPFNLNNCHDINIYNCYAGLGKRGIVLSTCTGNIVITYCWFSKFTDAVSGTAPANGGGSAVQWQQCSGSGNKGLYNKVYIDGSVSTNGVGDLFSLYKCLFGSSDTFSGVTGGFGMEVAYNEFRGGSSSPSGYAAIVGGDVGGSNQYIHDNIACNTGKVGMQVQGGTNINMSNNIIYGAVLSYTSVGLSFGNYSSLACNTITMGGNKINFYSASNSGVYNKFFDQGITSSHSTSTGVAGGAALAQPTGWTTNTADHTADPGAYDALLPDPLFSDGDWNTATTPLSFSPLASVATGTADYSPGAASSSNQGITYSSDNTAVATIVSKKIHVVSAGTANITANDQFNSITQTLTVTSTSTGIRYNRPIKFH